MTHRSAFLAFMAGVFTGVAVLIALSLVYGCTRDPRADVAKCEHREAMAMAAHQPIYAAAWAHETDRARLGLGCRDNIDAFGRITRD